jgi:hypothetical protein
MGEYLLNIILDQCHYKEYKKYYVLQKEYVT